MHRGAPGVRIVGDDAAMWVVVTLHDESGGVG
jgi:hypothetical protein